MYPHLGLCPAGSLFEARLAAARSGGVLLLVAACLPTHAARAAACPASTVDELYACLDQLAPGDSLEIAPGRYEVSGISLEGINGEPDLPITLEGTGDGVEIVGVNPQANVISFHDNHDLVLRNLDISFIGGASDGNGVDTLKFETGVNHDILIEDCILHDTGNVLISSQAPEIYRITVRHNHLYNAGLCCMYWGYLDESTHHYAHDSVIEWNLMNDCPVNALSQEGYGIQIKAGSYGNLIQDNVLADVAGTTRAGIIVYHTAADVGEPLRADNVLRGNLVMRSRNEGIDAAAAAVVENNIVIDAASYGFYFQGRDGYTGPVQVRNNTAYLSSSSGNDRGFMFSGWEGVDAGSSIVNNLSIMSRADLVAFRAPDGVGGAVSSSNLAYGSADISGVTLLSDPLEAVQSLAYGDQNYLFPVVGGPAVNAGDPTLAAAEDFNALTRDAWPDIGAYESSDGGNPGWILQEAIKGETASGDGGDDDGGTGCGGTVRISRARPAEPAVGGAVGGPVTLVVAALLLRRRRSPKRRASGSTG